MQKFIKNLQVEIHPPSLSHGVLDKSILRPHFHRDSVMQNFSEPFMEGSVRAKITETKTNFHLHT